MEYFHNILGIIIAIIGFVLVFRSAINWLFQNRVQTNIAVALAVEALLGVIITLAGFYIINW